MTARAAPAPASAPWTRIFRVDRLAEGGLHDRIEASVEERAAIRDFLGLEDLTGLEFAFALTPLARGRVRLRGRVEAAVTQSCVVTLEPVPGHVAEDVEIEFWPEAQLAPPAGEREVEIAFDGAEPLPGEELDLGQLAYEILAAALDPYPRAPGARLDWTGDEDAGPEDGPFAALKGLKRQSEK